MDDAMTPIKGTAQATLAQARAWAEAKGAHQRFIDILPFAWQHGPRYDIRPEVVVSLAAKETRYGNFGGVLDHSFHNWGGLKTAAGGGNYDPNAHQRFPSDEIGVIAVIQHLAAYTGAGATTWPDPVYDERWVRVTQPWVLTVEALNNRWAGPDYGTTLVSNFLDPLMATPPPSGGGTVNIISPTQWGARKDYDSWSWSDRAWQFDVLHWGGNPQPTANNGPAAEMEILRAWERYHLSRGWAGLAYSLGIGQSGNCYRIRGDKANAANGSRTNNRIGKAIVFIIGSGTTPSVAALATYSALWATHRRPVKGHRDLKSTTCPGNTLYSWLTSGGYQTAAPPEVDDMLKRNDTGADVARFQDALRDVGFDPGASDGVYGPATSLVVAAAQGFIGFEVNGDIATAPFMASLFARQMATGLPSQFDATITIK